MRVCEGITARDNASKLLLLDHELGLCSLELCLGLFQCLTPWPYLFGNDIVLADGKDPLAYAFSCL